MAQFAVEQMVDHMNPDDRAIFADLQQQLSFTAWLDFLFCWAWITVNWRDYKSHWQVLNGVCPTGFQLPACHLQCWAWNIATILKQATQFGGIKRQHGYHHFDLRCKLEGIVINFEASNTI